MPAGVWGLGQERLLCLFRHCVSQGTDNTTAVNVFSMLQAQHNEEERKLWFFLVCLRVKVIVSACRGAVHSAEESIQTGRSTSGSWGWDCDRVSSIYPFLMGTYTHKTRQLPRVLPGIIHKVVLRTQTILQHNKCCVV